MTITLLELEISLYTSEEEGAHEDIEFFQTEIKDLISLEHVHLNELKELQIEDCKCFNCGELRRKISGFRNDITILEMNIAIICQIINASSALLALK